MIRRGRPAAGGRRRWVVAVGVVLLAVTIVGVLSGLRLVSASRDLREAEDLVDSAALAIEDGRLADARSELATAQTLLTSANESLYGSLELEVVVGVPVLRQNIASLRDSIGLAATIVNGGRRILEASIPLESAEGKLEVSLSDGTIPLSAVTAAREEIATLTAQLPPGLQGDDRLLAGSVRELRTAVYEESARRRAQLDVLSRGLALLQHLAGAEGPRRYLLAVANTAEMRGSGGMILNYGVLEGEDGVIDLTSFGRIDELDLDEGIDVDAIDLPEDYQQRWEGFEPTERWRNANMAGDFTIVAPVLESMYEQATDEEVDGVIQVDPAGLAAVLKGVGPVLVAELGEVTTDNVLPLVLNEAYQRFPGIEERSDVLGDVAEAAFRRLVDGDIPSLRPLAEAVAGAVDGRHLLLHSTTGAIEAAGGYFGASGDLPPAEDLDSMHLTVQNVSANKLDYFVDTALKVTGRRPHGAPGLLEAEVVVANTAPAGQTEPRYIYGPNTPDQQPGLYRSIVTLYLPTGTSLVSVEGDPVRNPPVTQTEGGRPLVSWSVDVPAGESRRLLLGLHLAPLGRDPYRLTVVPAPRVRPTTVTVDIDAEGGAAAGKVELDRTYVFGVDQEPRGLAGVGGRAP